MKFDVVNKSTTVNIFILHTLHRSITHLAVITRETNIKLGILFRLKGELENSQNLSRKKPTPGTNFPYFRYESRNNKR